MKGSLNFQTRSMNIKPRVVVFSFPFLATSLNGWVVFYPTTLRFRWRAVRISNPIDKYKSASCGLFLSEGVSGRLPDRDLDEGQSKYLTRLTNIKARVVVFFLSFFGNLSEGMSGRLPDRDLDEGQSKFPDPIDKYKSVSCCFFLVLFWRPLWRGEWSFIWPRFRWRAVRISRPDQ